MAGTLGCRWGMSCALAVGCTACDEREPIASPRSLVDEHGAACVPEIAWSQLGGSAIPPGVPNAILDLAAHPDGGAAVIGRFYIAADFGSTHLATDYSLAGGFEFVARVVGRIGADGQYAWARKIRDWQASTGSASKIATGSDGTLAVASAFGNTVVVEGPDGIQLSRSVDPVSPGGAVGDAYVLVFAADGALRWGRVLGDDRHSDYATAVAVRDDGSVVVATSSLGGGSTGRLTAFDADGTQAWTYTLADWTPDAIAVAPDGELVVTGRYTGNIALHGGSTAPTDGLAVLGIRVGENAPRWALGDPDWHTLRAPGLAIAADGSVYVAGYDAALPLYDGFVARIATDHALAWQVPIAGDADEYVNDVTLDAAGDVVVTGNFSGQLGTLHSQGSTDGFAAWFSPDGDALELAAFDVGSGFSAVNAIAATPEHALVVGGMTSGTTELGTTLGTRALFAAGIECTPAITDFAVAADSLASDRVGPGDAGLLPDGTADGVFDVTVRGPVSSLSLVPVFPDGSLYYYWHYDTVVGSTPIADAIDTYWSTGAQTWVLGVVDRDDGALLNAPDGSVALGDGVHRLALHGTDAELHGRGLSWRLVVERPDGSLVWSDIVTDASLVRLDALAQVTASDDRVAPGDLGLAPDGGCDLAFDLTLTGRVRALALISTDAAGTPTGGQQWDTIVGDTPIPAALGTGFPFGAWTWALGVFAELDMLDPSGALIEDRNLWTRTVRLFGADDWLAPGQHFRVVAELHDGTLVHSEVVTTQASSCDEPSSCCTATYTQGCADDEVEACVCSFDPYCCDVAWDGLCAAEAAQCGGC